MELLRASVIIGRNRR